MPTPTSQLGMSHIQTEFGGSNPIALSEYYGVNANVPASGTIRMAQFLGISAGPTVSMPANSSPAAVWALDAYPGEAYTEFVMWANGTWQMIGGSTVNPASGTWLTSGTNSQVDVRCTYTGGGSSFTSWSDIGSGVWGPMSSTHSWALENFSGGTIKSCYFTIDLRANSNGTILLSRTGYLESEAEK